MILTDKNVFLNFELTLISIQPAQTFKHQLLSDACFQNNIQTPASVRSDACLTNTLTPTSIRFFIWPTLEGQLRSQMLVWPTLEGQLRPVACLANIQTPASVRSDACLTNTLSLTPASIIFFIWPTLEGQLRSVAWLANIQTPASVRSDACLTNTRRPVSSIRCLFSDGHLNISLDQIRFLFLANNQHQLPSDACFQTNIKTADSVKCKQMLSLWTFERRPLLLTKQQQTTSQPKLCSRLRCLIACVTTKPFYNTSTTVDWIWSFAWPGRMQVTWNAAIRNTNSYHRESLDDLGGRRKSYSV